ncbi:nose resistant to fluoxetine protein 6-like [Neocloeon triangulifer]|uniref:nose resistant to fluoxetine protein 6-like n=1 Tax=Neocloeon triangulifer TaxID=2078957 RepID=UPI00286F8AEF|nr:nose resistant to fluoxetine protein 6-like [Neocloeon triangulifer]
MEVVFVLGFALLFSSARSDCDSDVEEYFQGLTSNSPKLWALEMFDSSIKSLGDGYMELSFIYQLGNFDECLAVEGPITADGKPRFTGQYCQFAMGLQGIPQMEHLMQNNSVKETLQIQRNLRRILHHPDFQSLNEPFMLPTLWGVCVPSSCGIEGAKRVADFNMQFYANSIGFMANTSVYPENCYYENDGSEVLDAGSWSFIAFAIILVAIIFVATIIDVSKRELNNSGMQSCVKAFSLKQNLTDLLALPKVHATGQLSCLHGMRTLSMLWIILCHTYSNAGAFPLVNYVSYTQKFSQQWFMAPILNGYMAVDTFFLLSGLLTVYVPMMDLTKGRKFNIFKYYIYRYLRITVPLAVVIWFLATVSFHLGKGPLWIASFEYPRQICQDYWWASLIYIANYFYENCLGQAWYLCVDMQLALLAPLIIYPLMKWPKFGLTAIFLLTLGSVGAVFGVTYVEKLPWTMQIDSDIPTIERYWDIIYVNTPMRAAPYLCGMALGYVLSKKMQIPVPRWGVALGWFLSMALILGVIFLSWIPYNESYDSELYEPLAAAFFGSFHRLAWSLGLSWIIWACVNGLGGIINSILSWQYFLPLSKLTFSAYLTHLAVMGVQMGLRRVPSYVSHFENFYLFSGFLLLIMPYTLFIYLAVEAPLMSLMRLAFKKKTESATKRIDKILGKKS